MHDSLERGEASTDAPPSLSVELSLSRPAVIPHLSEDEPLHVLIRVSSHVLGTGETAARQPDSPHQVIRSSSDQVITPSPRHLSLVLDASGSMHRIVLEGSEREQWRQVAQERGDL